MGAFSVSGTFILPSGHTAAWQWKCEPRHMFAQAITRFMIFVPVDSITVHRKNQSLLVEDRLGTKAVEDGSSEPLKALELSLRGLRRFRVTEPTSTSHDPVSIHLGFSEDPR